jgi:hypothetical protein
MGRYRRNGGSLGSLGHISGMLSCCRPWRNLNSTQTYFFTVVSGYGSGQRGDHEKFNSVYSMTGLNSVVGLANHSDPWDARVEPAPGGHFAHTRQESTASDTGMLNHYGDAPRGVAPVPTFHSTGYSSKSNYSRHDEYNDPYYSDSRQQ